MRHPRDGYIYSFPRCRSKDGATDGVCIMRTTEQQLANPRSWRFWRGGGTEGFTGAFTDPYTQAGTPQPAIVQFGSAVEAGSSPSQPVPRYMPYLNLFVISGYCNMPGAPPRNHFGFSFAPEPWGPWSEMRPITGVDVNPTHDTPFTRGLYPSLLDPNSPSLNYDTLEGGEAFVYWVQGRNKTVVHAPDMARDLWRQRVRISWS